MNTMCRKAIGYFVTSIRENVLFIIFMYILGVVNALVESYYLGYNVSLFIFLSLFFDIYILCFFISLWSVRLRKYVMCFLSTILYSLCIINVFCVSRFYAKLGPEILNLILETNPREAEEFFDNYVSCDVLFSPVLVIVLICIIHIFFYCHRHHKYLKNGVVNNNIIYYCMLSLFFVCSFLCFYSRYKFVRMLCAPDIVTIDKFIDNRALNTPANNLLFAIKMRQLSLKGLVQLTKTQEQSYIDSCSFVSDNIILIIGESYIKGHSQLYGYKKETTPYQVKRVQDSISGKLVPFDDVISPSNLTSVVFKNIMSLHSVEDSMDWTYYPLFPVLFRKAGYQVTFITNQFVKSLGVDVFNFSGGLFLNDNKLSQLQFDLRNNTAHRYDEDLLADYDSLKHLGLSHNLIIFHLAGQHFDFNKRCPDQMKLFSANDYEDRHDLSHNEKQLVADYDNATRYNDYVVNEIIKKFDGSEAVVIYMPDHGEECFDEIHRMGRIAGDKITAAMARQEYCIPFWIWCSNEYISSHAQIYNEILKYKNRPFMTDDISHLLLYLAGIKTRFYTEKRNVLSMGYNCNRIRLIEGRVNYDELVK